MNCTYWKSYNVYCICWQNYNVYCICWQSYNMYCTWWHSYSVYCICSLNDNVYWTYWKSSNMYCTCWLNYYMYCTCWFNYNVYCTVLNRLTKLQWQCRAKHFSLQATAWLILSCPSSPLGELLARGSLCSSRVDFPPFYSSSASHWASLCSNINTGTSIDCYNQTCRKIQ